MAKQRKRFIAGANCPECGATDTLMLYTEGGIEHVNCVECNYYINETQQQAKDAGVEETNADQVIGLFKPH